MKKRIRSWLVQLFPYLMGDVRGCRACGREWKKEAMYYRTGFGWFCNKEEAESYWVPFNRWDKKPKRSGSLSGHTPINGHGEKP